MNEAVLILRNMRGGCATVDNKVHALFRITSRRPRPAIVVDEGLASSPDECTSEVLRKSGSK